MTAWSASDILLCGRRLISEMVQVSVLHYIGKCFAWLWAKPENTRKHIWKKEVPYDIS